MDLPTRRIGALFAWALWLATAATPAPAATGAERIQFTSANRSTSIDALYKGKARYDEVIHGDLTLPDSPKGPVPAMVIMHGSGGVEGGTALKWARFFRAMGIASFVVDSFGPRGIAGTASDQSQITYTTSGIDALKALDALAKDPRIDASRVGVIGFSRGGVATQQAAFERFKLSVVPDGLKFAVHFPLYGGCSQYGKTTGAPVVHFVGDEDDTFRIEQCEKTTRLSNDAGASNRLVVLKGAQHGFDRDNLAWIRVPQMQVWKQCSFETDMDTLQTRIPGNDKATVGEVAAYRKSCMTLGAKYGGDTSASRATEREIVRVLTDLRFR